MSANLRAQGRISHGIAPGTAVQKTLQFVQDQLPAWRDMPGRPVVEAEEELNSQLCKFLNATARTQDFSMAYFHHEERQTGRRRVDLSALTPQPLIEGRAYFNLEPFLVLEAKRLPAPSREREREYVAGTESASGGIQRFKLGLHGASLPQAGMIGYVQQNSCKAWFVQINQWIRDLSSANVELWTEGDLLAEFVDDGRARISRCQSSNRRENSSSPQIQLTHLWVAMSGD